MAIVKPERTIWAVDVLSVKPDDKFLEIGCGRGYAVELISNQLRNGRITGVDRSSKAITAACVNNRQNIES